VANVSEAETVPSKLQLSESNTTIRFIVSCGPELDILRVRRITEPWFGSLIERVGNVIDIVDKWRVVEQF
jgi:hypothetical protein